MSNHTKCWLGCRPIETPPLCWWECKNGTIPFGKHVTVSLKIRQISTMRPSHPIPKYLPKKSESVSLYKDLSTNIHSALFVTGRKKTT